MKFPSVTTVLSPFSDFSMIRPEVLKRAAERGTRVHSACSAYGLGLGLWSCSMEKGDMPFYCSFLKWVEAIEPSFLSVEEEFKDDCLGYMGHPDAVISISREKRLTVIDYKTPMSISRSWFPQVAAYAHLARGCGYDVHRGLAVRLRRNGGTPIVTEVDIDGEPWAAFMNALGAYKYFNTGK